MKWIISAVFICPISFSVVLSSLFPSRILILALAFMIGMSSVMHDEGLFYISFHLWFVRYLLVLRRWTVCLLENTGFMWPYSGFTICLCEKKPVLLSVHVNIYWIYSLFIWQYTGFTVWLYEITRMWPLWLYARICWIYENIKVFIYIYMYMYWFYFFFIWKLSGFNVHMWKYPGFTIC